MDRTYLPSALRGTARHIRECRDDYGENPYEKLYVDSDYLDEAADEIDRLRARLEQAERERDDAWGLLREWQRMEQEGHRMSTADAIDAGLPDAWAYMVEKRDDLLGDEGD